MSLTGAQEKAVIAKGNVLLIAGAGTGKTKTLVERCLKSLLDSRPPCEISEILVVTFTEAAAAEMRQRLRDRLQERADHSSRDTRAAQQLALFETAHIGTLHSFCLDLVRRHFYLLELDPQFSVMSEEESRLLASEQLDALFADMYSAKTPLAHAVRDLIGSHGDGSDQSIRMLVHRLHDYAQTLPDPERWKESQSRIFSQKEPALWRNWRNSAIAAFKGEWLPVIKELAEINGVAKQCASLLQKVCIDDLYGVFSLLSAVPAAAEVCPRGKKGAWLEPLKDFFKDAQFLCSILPRPDGKDPLAEDWSWVSAQMQTLLELSSEFTARFSKAKRDLALADFHDLEQFALQLLWDNRANAPSPIALQWRKQFRHVLVDEYQDINAAQDQILKALSRDEPGGNRFLVGDLKQSIYRFRLAAPQIFQSYMREWRKGSGTVIPLNENFRSREGLLEFINSVFKMLMTEEAGGISYDEDAWLRFGAAEERKQLSASRSTSDPRVEFHLRIKAKANEANGEPAEGGESIADLEEAAKEARLVGLRLREMRSSKHAIWDEQLEQFRPVEWRDMAILLRSRSGKTEFYVREFSRLQIPLAAARGDFFESAEISDVLSLLAILDNPLQDVPVLAVLRSPLVGLSPEELAEMRLVAEGPFWVALRKWHQRDSECGMRNAECSAKISKFIDRYSRWRTLARQLSLSSCVEEILAETRYPEWLLTQSRGQERFANLQGFINLARKFDRFQRQGLLRFLLFVEAQKSAEAEPPVPTVIDENAVRLMSIHQSKGLEFPVVVLADTAKSFNFEDLKKDVILDEAYGICPMIKPPQSSKRYPSLPYWLGRKQQRNQLLGEELRLLYVAMTRARDTLLISASLSEKQLSTILQRADGNAEREIAKSRCLMDWLGLWLARVAGWNDPEVRSGECSLARWACHDDSSLAASARIDADGQSSPSPEFLLNPHRLKEVEAKLLWTYPDSDAVQQPAKASVSTLRRTALAQLEDEESDSVFQFRVPSARLPAARALDAGSITHAFMQSVSLEHVGSETDLRIEADRLIREGLLSKDEAAMIDFENVAAFWNSALGDAVLAKDVQVCRELPFTAKFRVKEISELLGLAVSPPGLADKTELHLEGRASRLPKMESDEFIVVQGVADLVLISTDGLQIIDFKTDNVSGRALDERAKQYELQLRLYGLALGRIYKRPVSGCWLYFLRAAKAVAVPPESTHSANASERGI